MACIFVTANFSEKCLLMGETFNFWRIVRSGPSRWWLTWGPWSGPYTGPFRSSEKISGTHHLSNMFATTTELYMIGFMSFHWLRKVFDSPWGQLLGRMLYMNKEMYFNMFVFIYMYMNTNMNMNMNVKMNLEIWKYCTCKDRHEQEHKHRREHEHKPSIHGHVCWTSNRWWPFFVSADQGKQTSVFYFRLRVPARLLWKKA